MVIEFLTPVAVPNVAPACSLYGVVVQSVSDHDRAFPFSARVLQKRLEALPIQTFPLRQTAKVDERRIDIDQADRPLAELALRHTLGC